MESDDRNVILFHSVDNFNFLMFYKTMEAKEYPTQRNMKTLGLDYK